jgi:hypothetical protein
MKWANDDHVRDLLTKQPAAQQFLTQHLQEMQAAMPKPIDPKYGPKVNYTFDATALGDPQVRELLDKAENITSAPPMGAPGAPKPAPAPAQGAGMSMKNSNSNSGKRNDPKVALQ